MQTGDITEHPHYSEIKNTLESIVIEHGLAVTLEILSDVCDDLGKVLASSGIDLDHTQVWHEAALIVVEAAQNEHVLKCDDRS